MPHPLTDEVVQEAQRGSHTAFSAIYVELSPKVLGYFRARGAADPEGLTSEVFLAVFSKLQSLTGGLAGLRTFVFSVAHHRLVDEVRRWQRQPGMTEFDPDTDERIAEAAEVAALDNVATQGVTRLLMQLNQDQKTVISLRVIADLTVEQVAEIMGKSPGAVKQLQRRGLLELKRLLDQTELTL